MERKKSLSSSSAQKTRTSLVVCFRGERESHAHQRRVFEEVVRCVAHPPRFGFAFWSRDLLVVPNAAKNTGNVTTTVGLSRCCVCVLRIEMIAKISPPPFFVCVDPDTMPSQKGGRVLYSKTRRRGSFFTTTTTATTKRRKVVFRGPRSLLSSSSSSSSFVTTRVEEEAFRR